MPWLAVPFEARDVKERLSKKFKVRGIPSLVLVDGDTGETINANARAAVLGAPDDFPWKPLGLEESLGPDLVKADGTTTSLADIRARKGHIAAYFSASWCGPCRSFTPKLVDAYNKLNADGKSFDVVLVSSDKDEGSFKEYLSHMPWHAVPFNNGDFAKKAGALSERFGVEGIPRLVILDHELNVVREDARGAVMKDAACANFPWPPPLVADVEDDPSPLNEEPCVVALIEDLTKEDQLAVRDAMTAAARASPKAASDGRALKFFFAEDDTGVAMQIRRLTKVGNPKEGKADFLLLDFANDGSFSVGGAASASETPKLVESVVSGFVNGTVEMASVRG